MTTTTVPVTVEVDHDSSIDPGELRDAVDAVIQHSTARDAVIDGVEAVWPTGKLAVSMFVPGPDDEVAALNDQAQLVAETLDDAAALNVVARFAERFAWDVKISHGPAAFVVMADRRPAISVDLLGLAAAMQIGPGWATSNVEWAARAMEPWLASIKPDIIRAAGELGRRVEFAQDGSPDALATVAEWSDPDDHDEQHELLLSVLAKRQEVWQRRAANAVRAVCAR